MVAAASPEVRCNSSSTVLGSGCSRRLLPLQLRWLSSNWLEGTVVHYQREEGRRMVWFICEGEAPLYRLIWLPWGVTGPSCFTGLFANF